jgi:hypothetical protein
MAVPIYLLIVIVICIRILNSLKLSRVSFLNPLGAAVAQLSKQLHLPRAGARVAVPGKHRSAPSIYWLAGVSKAELADCSVGKTPTRPARSAASNFFQKLEPIPLACDCLERVLNIWP